MRAEISALSHEEKRDRSIFRKAGKRISPFEDPFVQSSLPPTLLSSGRCGLAGSSLARI
jgi:hypothetical protein